MYKKHILFALALAIVASAPRHHKKGHASAIVLTSALGHNM